ncbi:acetyl xylan esterase [Arachidicoccus ginsenosidimutans]|uniref:SGNH/GDSL hydrolase family protein n=1 Tax=Arachidicoccus sp. BS20 TaxID=1850526 RepID=UPI0007F181FF|nr:SGNH/GDSL hydrolase family protein [Arachidicoccus sp. BS20]ANI90265.1 acetyl xylan esterase [Arachidicoccus sp. BS20]
MKKLLVLFLLLNHFCFAKTFRRLKFFDASNKAIHYVGRIDCSNPELPRFWSPGVYFYTTFVGPDCYVVLNDEVNYGVMHNYIEIVVDGKPRRIMLSAKTDTVWVAKNLSKGKHTLLVCKDTESGIGYLEVVGIGCRKLVNEKDSSKYLIEYFGDSITCGTSSDLSQTPCGAGRWEDQHNAYMSYGPTVARALNARWIISAVSGIGLIHSCCGMKITMPQVYDKLMLRNDSIEWNMNKMQPDVATICLGQNDGIQDSTKFCSAYVKFVKTLRSKYPNTTFILLTSPMADENLNKVLRNYLLSVQKEINNEGDKNVYHYFFKKRYYHGCDGHPDVDEHQQIAAELAPFIKQIKHW